MKRKSNIRGFTRRSVAATLLFCLVLVALSFAGKAAGSSSQSQGLTFAERVAYQRAIEEVYSRHRISPRAGPNPKPSLDSVMSQAQLEKKVADYLRNSQALEDYWQRPITADQLQAEMDRMAQHTKQPEVLRELFEALGNDPFVITECLARPALAERLLTNWYAYDQRVHGELKQRAEADLQAHLPAAASAEAGITVEQMKQLSGNYSEIALVKRDSSQGATNRDTEHGLKLNRQEWDETTQKLAAMFDSGDPVAAGVPPAQPTRLPPQKPDLTGTVSSAKDAPIRTGKLSSLQEDENRYYATAVIEKSKNSLTLATVTWLKKPLGPWVANAEDQVPATMAATSVGYALPNVSDGSTCIDDT
jgi:hypothetical protein